MFPLRDERPGAGFPAVTVCLIIATVAVFFYQLSLGDEADLFILRFALIPATLTHGAKLPLPDAIPPWLTLFTSLFIHGGWLHLLGNCWFFWVFGPNLESFLGHVRYFFFYFATGLLAGLFHVCLNAGSTSPTIGASGAISGVLGAYLVLYPRIRVRTLLFLGFFFDVVWIPAIFFLGLWFLTSLFGGLLSPESGIAFAEHIGGFLGGIGLVGLWTVRPEEPPLHRYFPSRVLRKGQRQSDARPS